MKGPRNELFIMVDSHKFVKTRNFKNTTHFLCSKKKGQKCKARIVVDKNNQIKSKNLIHSHMPTLGHEEIKKPNRVCPQDCTSVSSDETLSVNQLWW